MIFTTNSNGGNTEPLNSETGSQLAQCDSVDFGGDTGWVVAYGRDKVHKLLIAVHAKDRALFNPYLGSENGEEENSLSFHSKMHKKRRK